MVEQIISMLIIVALDLVLSWRPHLNTATFFEVIGLVLGYDGRPGSRRTQAGLRLARFAAVTISLR